MSVLFRPFAIATALIVGSFAPGAFAGALPNEHDGFFLRLTTGLGGSSLTASEEGTDVAIKGLSGVTNLAIGGCVSPDLAVHATIFGYSANEPEMEIKSSYGSASGKLDDVKFTNGVIGIGVTHYTMPSNFYLSGSIGLASLEAEGDRSDYSFDNGFGLGAIAGKEWWVSNNWGLGVAGVFNWSRVSDSEVDWNATSYGVVFSATFN